MPVYDYKCTACGERQDDIYATANDSILPCPDCGGTMNRIWTRTGFVHGDEIKPFWCPVSDRIISSRNEWQKVMRENNLECKGDAPRLSEKNGMREDGAHRKRLGID